MGGQKIALYAEVLDSQDRLLSGFHSSLSFTLPESAGSFSTQTVAIENGKTQITFTIFDRYGNRIIKNNSSGMPVALNFTGTLKRNSDVPIDVSFIG